MKKLLVPTVLFSSLWLLQGCIGAAVMVGSAAVATKTATDPRTVGRQMDDTTLESRVNAALAKDKELQKVSRVVDIAYQSKVLLVGQTPNQAFSDRAKQIAMKVPGVKAVYNEIRIGKPIGFGTSSSDSWITTKIKSEFLTSNLVKSSSVKVVTENGEVFLLGVVTQQEGQDAALIASKVSGVKRVTKAFDYLN